MEVTPDSVKAALLEIDPGLAGIHGGFHVRTNLYRDPGLWCWGEVERHVLARVAKDEAILDIGCGVGIWALHLWSLGYRNLHLVDRSERYLEVASELLKRFGATAKVEQSNTLEVKRGPVKLLTAFGFLFDVRRHLAVEGEQDEDKPLAPRDWLNKAIDALQYGGLAAFDWYTWEQDVKPRRSYCGSYDLVGQAPTGLDPYLVMSRAFGGRETGLYVFQRTP
jgi:SAM-dependent methyltransferase